MQKSRFSKVIPGEWDSLPDVFGVAELAQFLGIGMTTAYELVNSEGFSIFRVGRNIRITKAGLQAWIEMHSS